MKHRICESCGMHLEKEGAFRSISGEEMVQSGGGIKLLTLLKEREKNGPRTNTK